jgi:hypothetical protein
LKQEPVFIDHLVIYEMDLAVVPVADPDDVPLVEGSVPLDETLVLLGPYLVVTTAESVDEQALVPAVVTTSRFHTPLTSRLTAPDVLQFEVNLGHEVSR